MDSLFRFDGTKLEKVNIGIDLNSLALSIDDEGYLVVGPPDTPVNNASPVSEAPDNTPA